MIIINLERIRIRISLSSTLRRSLARFFDDPRFDDAPWGWRNGWRIDRDGISRAPRFETKCAR